MFELLIYLMLACAPANYPTSPTVDSRLVGDTLVSVHANAAVSMVGIVPAEEVLVCSVADDTQTPQDPVPSLSTTWKATDNTTHTVTTPIPSTTPAGLERAVVQHTELVRMMKVIYPPVPNP